MAGAGGLAALQAPAQTPTHVVFLNPGTPGNPETSRMWASITRLMTACARSLGMLLEVIHAGMDRALMLRQAQALARREPAPDYVVITNDKMAAPEMLQALARSPARVLLIHSDLTPAQRRETGRERELHPNWIGTLLPDNARGSYRLMDALYGRLPAGAQPQIVGLGGPLGQPTAGERAEGIQAYVGQARRGRILQVAHNEVIQADIERRVQVLLARYPQVNIIWAINDAVALTALKALRTSGARVLVGGVGGWPEARASIAQGDLTATIDGHYLIGAIAMLALHDHHRGWDFAAHGGPQQRLDILQVVDSEHAATAVRTLYQDADQLDFRPASRVLFPRPGPLDFRVETLLHGRKAA